MRAREVGETTQVMDHLPSESHLGLSYPILKDPFGEGPLWGMSMIELELELELQEQLITKNARPSNGLLYHPKPFFYSIS